MSKNNLLIKNNGELLDPNRELHKDTFKADSPFEKKWIPYIIMLFCCITDVAMMLSLFKQISYDTPLMLAIQTGALVFAYDIIPIFLGIHYKRLKQHITKDYATFVLSLAICLVAVALNVYLNIMTIDMMQDAPSFDLGFADSAVTQTHDPAAIALCVLRMICPVLTSVGSFIISAISYNPLKLRQQRLEHALNEERDVIRRLQGVVSEHLEFDSRASQLRMSGKQEKQTMMLQYLSDAIKYYSYVKQRLKEHLGDASSISALSENSCAGILVTLDKEMNMLIKEMTTLVGEDKAKTFLERTQTQTEYTRIPLDAVA